MTAAQQGHVATSGAPRRRSCGTREGVDRGLGIIGRFQRFEGVDDGGGGVLVRSFDDPMGSPRVRLINRRTSSCSVEPRPRHAADLLELCGRGDEVAVFGDGGVVVNSRPWRRLVAPGPR